MESKTPSESLGAGCWLALAIALAAIGLLGYAAFLVHPALGWGFVAFLLFWIAGFVAIVWMAGVACVEEKTDPETEKEGEA